MSSAPAASASPSHRGPVFGITLSIIAAVADNGVIGHRGGMPWRLSTDLRRFRRLTVGHPVIMGRRTWEGLPGPLRDRTNIVVSSDPAFSPEGAIAVRGLDAAIETAGAVARRTGVDEIFLIGGGRVYSEAIGSADRLYVTHVRARPEGDTRFPEIDPRIWYARHRETVPAGSADSAETEFVIYERRTGPTG